MKQKIRASDYFSAALLSLTISLGAVLCPITAFSLDYSRRILLPFLILAALLLPLLFYLPKRKLTWFLFWLLAAHAGFRLRNELSGGLQYAVLIISTRFSRAYQAFPPVNLGWKAPMLEDCAYIFALLGLIANLCVSWTVLRRQTAFPVFCIAAVSLTLCVIDLSSFADTVPLLLLLGGVLLLALTQGTRRQGSGSGRLTLSLAVPVLLLLAVLLFLNPKENYKRSQWSDSLESQVTDALARLPFLEKEGDQLVFSPTDFATPFETAVVNLRSVGPHPKTGIQVMSVRSDKSGYLYLRGASLGNYTGGTWEPVSDSTLRKAVVSDWHAQSFWDLGESYTVDIETKLVSKVLYTPYGSTALSTDDGSGQTSTPYYDVYFQNDRELSQYSITYTKNGWNPTHASGSYLHVLNYLTHYYSTDIRDINDWMEGQLSATGSPIETLHYNSMLEWYNRHEEYTAFVDTYYTQLPEQTRRGLEAIIHENGLDRVTGADTGIPDRAAQAFAIADYVRASARYDLNTQRMPFGQDFVLWFLNESDTGYCVHFASATVALLRAMDIPARYVIGYTTEVTAGQWTTVSTDDAHAWAEFYLPGLGWVPLESTPGSYTSASGWQEPTVPETEPETTPATEETEPAETTGPSDATEPSTTPPDSTAPTQGSNNSSPPVPPGTGGTGAPMGNSTGKAFKIPWNAIFSVVWKVLTPILLLVLYRGTVLIIRGRAMRDRDLNRRAVAQYLRLKKIAKSAKVPVPEELTALANRARFSQYRLTPAELQPLTQFHSTLVSSLRARPWYRRFWDRWILVLY